MNANLGNALWQCFKSRGTYKSIALADSVGQLCILEDIYDGMLERMSRDGPLPSVCTSALEQACREAYFTLDSNSQG